MFVFDDKDERYLQYMQEINKKFDQVVFPKEEEEDTRSLVHQVLDCEFKYQDIGVAHYEVTTTKGTTIVPKEELIAVCASQAFCVEPTRELAPLLPPRGVASTGQLKLCADVVAMMKKLKKTDKVLVIGSSSEHEQTGSAYFMLAGRVAQVDMYDPYEVAYPEAVIKGTRFRFHKEFWMHRKVKGYDVVFDDAWLGGGTIMHDIRAREYSQKVFSIQEHRRVLKKKGYYHGQIHVTEKRFTNTPRYYQGYKHIGSCAACVEIGYFNPDFDVYDRLLLSASHGIVKCTSRIPGCARRIGVYADLMFNRMVFNPPAYERTTKPIASISVDYDTSKDVVFSFNGCNLLRRVNTYTIEEPVRFDHFPVEIKGAMVQQIDISSFLVFEANGVLIIMDRCYKILALQEEKIAVESEYNDFFVSRHVDNLLVDLEPGPRVLLVKGVKILFTWGQLRQKIARVCRHVFALLRARQW